MTALITGKHFAPVLLLEVLALFFCLPVHAQSLKDLPPPPPAPTPRPTPKPTPTPEPKDEDFEVVRVNSNLVMVPVSVVDANGQPVHGLLLNDFRLYEQDKSQEISEIGNPDQVPLDIALLFDVSSSVSQKGFFAFQEAAAASFLKQVLKPMDRAAIFTISDVPHMVAPLESSEAAAANILSIQAATTPVPTAFYDTVTAAAKFLAANSAERHRRVILVISDGDDNFSTSIKDLTIAEVRASENAQVTPAVASQNAQNRRDRAVKAVQKAVQQADIAFYSVNPGGNSVRLNKISLRAQNDMQSIAESTGGTAFVPDGEKDLERVFSEVAAELRGQYLVQYYSNSQSSPGMFRTIRVEVPTHPELRVRARQGYYPKSADK